MLYSNKWFVRTLSGLMLLSLMQLLASCKTTPVVPAKYLDPCTLTYLPKGEVMNGDVVRLALSREYDMRLCNGDKRAIRAWYEGYCQSSGVRCPKSFLKALEAADKADGSKGESK